MVLLSSSGIDGFKTVFKFSGFPFLKRFTNFKRFWAWRKVLKVIHIYTIGGIVAVISPFPGIFGDPHRLGELSLGFRGKCKNTLIPRYL
jgi:hypothetical protein